MYFFDFFYSVMFYKTWQRDDEEVKHLCYSQGVIQLGSK